MMDPVHIRRSASVARVDDPPDLAELSHCLGLDGRCRWLEELGDSSADSLAGDDGGPAAGGGPSLGLRDGSLEWKLLPNEWLLCTLYSRRAYFLRREQRNAMLRGGAGFEIVRFCVRDSLACPGRTWVGFTRLYRACCLDHCSIQSRHSVGIRFNGRFSLRERIADVFAHRPVAPLDLPANRLASLPVT